MNLPQDGDIVRTRIITHTYGRNTITTFWWRIIHWDSGVPIHSWCSDVVFRYLLSMLGWLNGQIQVTFCKFRNLTNDEGEETFYTFGQGAFVTENVRVCESTVWCTRVGIDGSGIERASHFPISCIATANERGRAVGDGPVSYTHLTLPTILLV